MKFHERKVAQMAAYLLRLRGGRMSKLKLMKLLYLAERESLRLYGVPMTGDRLISMDHGPVLCKTLDLIRDTAIDAAEDGWNSLIMQKNVHDLELIRSVQDDDLDELSKADIDVLDSVWRELTRCTKSVSLSHLVAELSRYLVGWRGYFGFCEPPSVLRRLDQWIRRRLRAVVWRHWKRGRTRFAALSSSKGASPRRWQGLGGKDRW